MINLTNLNRQHDSIMAEIVLLEEEIKKGSNAMDTAKAALHISKLAGLLKIHLLEEDKFLYPDLFNSANNEIKDLAQRYNKEMGSLSEEYTDFKNNYNVGNKLKGKEAVFLSDAKKIIEILKRRISKENTELYRIIKEKNL
jgi:hemerythrin-like domain-containing protein